MADSRSPNQHLQPLSSTVTAEGHLTVGGCDVVDLAARFGTPLYIVDELTLRTACAQYVEALRVHYPGPSQALFATKAWSNLAICAIAHAEGLGMDVVSLGEMITAERAGVPGDLIYLHGNNKSEAEIRHAIAIGSTIVADSHNDLDLIERVVAEPAAGQIPVGQAPARVMVRVTPGIDIHTHEYIRTGHIDSKFGFQLGDLGEVLARLARTERVRAVGLHAHIGSQSFELAPHADVVSVLMEWYPKAQALGLVDFSELNVGGGLGIRYVESDDPPSIDEWVRTIAKSVVAAATASGLPLPRLLCEPGRSLVGPACLTAYTVGSLRTIPGVRTYAAVDGGMSDNPRPITYGARYTAAVANRMHDERRETVTVAGKHCESGDVLLRDVALAPLTGGDCLVVFCTGAYNCSMSSNYNRLERPAAVLVHGGEAQLILRRETVEDLVRLDCLPERLRQ